MKIQVTRPIKLKANFDISQKTRQRPVEQWFVVGVDEENIPRMLVKLCVHETTRKRHGTLWIFGSSTISATTVGDCFSPKGSCLYTMMKDLGYEFSDDGLYGETDMYEHLMGLAKYEFPNHRYLYFVDASKMYC